ncbi:MAG: carbohydrate kinase family protein [Chloroflexi bacterium]|nr:carbohydrate kinase family protein [Chloroflexota bacterium]
MAEAVVAGHLCLDIIPDLSSMAPGQFDASFLPGRLTQSGPARLSTGGAVSNTGIALHRLGINTRLIARTGKDILGTALQQCVEQQGKGLAEGLISRAESATSYSVVISPPDVDRRFLHHPGANDDFLASDVSDSSLADARLLHFGYPPLMARMYANDGVELRTLMMRAKTMGLTTSLDMAYPDPDSSAGHADWQAILRNVLPFVDIFVPSFDEISFMLWKKTNSTLSKASLLEISELLLGMGTKLVLLKLGSRGLFLRAADRDALSGTGAAFGSNMEKWADFCAWLPCFKVNVVGTTGAGDVTVAGFLSAVLRGLAPLDAMKAALGVGACCVETTDAISGIRGWDETLQRIHSGWDVHAEPEQFVG